MQTKAQPLSEKIDLSSIPESEINLRFQIDLSPFYAMADKQVDTLFTSPGYPKNWSYSGCDTRYKYSFQRSPLKFNLNGTTLTISFRGYYRIIGSTRVCVGNRVLSPWTPECKCGFEEGERTVNISYTVQFFLLKNYKIMLKITRNEPQPLDRCTVCFWGQDITSTVMTSLKTELDISKRDMEKNYSSMDLRPQFQKIWQQLSAPYNLNSMGWLQINPQSVRITRFVSNNNRLDLSIGLTAKPIVSFIKPVASNLSLPNISDYKRMKGFNVFIDGHLRYDSLSNMLSREIKGKEFEFRKAFIKKKFIFESCKIVGLEKGRLRLEIKFGGTDRGFFFVNGLPRYTDSTKIFSFEQVTFDLKSTDIALKLADWIFSKKITDEIESKARYDLTEYANLARQNVSKQLNQEFAKGIFGSGSLAHISIQSIQPFMDYLLIRMSGQGSLVFKINSEKLDLK